MYWMRERVSSSLRERGQWQLPSVGESKAEITEEQRGREGCKSECMGNGYPWSPDREER